MDTAEAHPLVSLIAAFFWVILWLLSWGRALIAFATISVPRFIYTALSYSLTFTLNFYSLALIFSLSVMIGAFLIRIRYLNDYQVLREPPLTKPDPKELHPDVHSEDVPPTLFHNYLDEFLQAIRVFGFLEKPVFHELARHLQTRRLIAGDSLYLDQDKSFYCVIDGTVQVYAQTTRQSPDSDTGTGVQWDEEDMNGYQLLNEVKSGGTLSSLFTILSLFTEDIKISWQEAAADIDRVNLLKRASIIGSSASDKRNRGSQMSLDRARGRSRDVRSPPSGIKTSRDSSLTSTILADDFALKINGNGNGNVNKPRPALKRNITAHIPASVARATQDTTLVVIPAEAFKRLTKKFPKASAHIVQVILTRFARVTFNAAHKYLGLTTELLRTEKLINDIAFHPLPRSFYEGGGLQTLRARFDTHTTSTSTTLDKDKDRDRDRDNDTLESSEADTVSGSDYLRYTPTNRLTSLPRSLEDRDRDTILSGTGTGGPTREREREVIVTATASAPDVRIPGPTPLSASPVREGRGRGEESLSQAPEPDSDGQSRSGDLGSGGSRTSTDTTTSTSTTTGIFASTSKRSRSISPYSTLQDRPASLHSHSGSGSGSAVPEFDLRAEVMSCMAKSIGLIQPPAGGDSDSPSEGSVSVSIDVGTRERGRRFSPLSSPRSGTPPPRMGGGGGGGGGGGIFTSSFGSLSMLEADMGLDDMSTSSASISVDHHEEGHDDFVVGSVNEEGRRLGLDNEVEIRFFDAGSVLVMAGEKNAGLFYVIDGLLDVSMPSSEDTRSSSSSATGSPSDRERDRYRYRDREERGRDRATRRERTRTSGQSRYSGYFPSASSIRNESFRGTGEDGLGESTSNLAEKKQRQKQKHLFTVKPGGIAGYLASLTGTPSYVDITAKTDVYVGFLPSHALERLLEKRPIVLLTLAKRLISLLSPLVLHIDSSLDWMQVSAGQVLWRPGDPSDSFYIVLNGRLRAFSSEKEREFSGGVGSGGGGGVDIVGEYGQGDTVGELDVITNSERSTTLHAIRDTELARMPLTLFNAISMRNPQTTVQLLRKIASGVRTKMHDTSSVSAAAASEIVRPGHGSTTRRNNNFNLKTVAILPSTRDIPIMEFAKKLHAALEGIGAPTSSLNQASVTQHLGRHAFTRMGKLKVAGWLADLEQRFRIVLYVADSPVNSPWTQTCIRQADYVMVVGMGDDPVLGEYERLLLSMKSTARKELVLLHPDRSTSPGSTREWLKIRPWVHAHMHVELPIPKMTTRLQSSNSVSTTSPSSSSHHDPAAVTALKILKSRVEIGLRKYRGLNNTSTPRRGEYASDFARLARRLCGKSVGVVLGGGGARGLAHLGALRALEEYHIPIDYIGGTSIGAFVGGLYARDVDIIASAGRAKQFSSRVSNIWRMLSDVTWPVVAYTTGHEFNRSVYKTFYDLHIEDMWLPYFCNTSNILTSRMEIHETGYAWRYIRASMTLAGIIPPLCDNGSMLMDGGYIDNLPVSTMFSVGASAVIAVDVGSLDDNSPRNFGDTVSGWWILLNRWNPFSSTRSIPAITEIQSRLAYVSSVKTLEEAKNYKGCLYMAMPVQEYGTMQFGKFEEIQEKGYLAMKKQLEKWDEEGRLPVVYEDDSNQLSEMRSTSWRKRGKTLRRNSV